MRLVLRRGLRAAPRMLPCQARDHAPGLAQSERGELRSPFVHRFRNKIQTYSAEFWAAAILEYSLTLPSARVNRENETKA